MVRFWGFRAPLGAWVAIWGAFAMLTSAPFDDWWHNAYGLDVKVLSPPHSPARRRHDHHPARRHADRARRPEPRAGGGGPPARPRPSLRGRDRGADDHHPAGRVQRAEPPARRPLLRADGGRPAVPPGRRGALLAAALVGHDHGGLLHGDHRPDGLDPAALPGHPQARADQHAGRPHGAAALPAAAGRSPPWRSTSSSSAGRRSGGAGWTR